MFGSKAYEKAEVVRMLLGYGGNVGAKDYKGRTTLHIALDCGSVEVVRVLLEHGANVGAEDDKDRTPSRLRRRMDTTGL